MFVVIKWCYCGSDADVIIGGMGSGCSGIDWCHCGGTGVGLGVACGVDSV